ncbi:MAG: cation:proton antiporter [Clostridia bacterium]|nr:cation:proton antiporter [Clostridia bacterium]
MQAVLSLAVAMVFGLLLTRPAKLIHLPNVTAYLVAGLIVGPYCLNVFHEGDTAVISVLTSIALGFIAFSIGVEFKFSHIKKIGSSSITITILQACLATLLVDVTLIAFGFPLPLSLTLGAIAAATAPAATLMVVRQYHAKGPVTSTLLPVVAMDDAVGLILFSVSLSVSQALSGSGGLTVRSMLLEPLAEIVLSLVVGCAIGLLIAVSMRFFHSKANRLSIAVTAVLAGSAIASIFNLSSLLLCMAIGACLINLRNDAESVLEVTDSWTPPLFMLFFVLSGAELDLAVVPTVGLVGILYLVARSLGKYFGSFLGASIVKASPNIRKYLGITLLPQAGVAIGMAQVALTALPAYGTKIQAVVLSATLIYELIGPVLTKMALTAAGEIEQSGKGKSVQKQS